MKDLKKQLRIWQNQLFIKQLKEKFSQAEIFLVGGAVRDIILGRVTKDFDFVVRNVSKSDLQKFLSSQGKVNLVGKRFGVFKFRPKGWDGEEIDIALPRTEHSINLSGAYRDFKIKSNAKLKIEDDLSRRDFTINAMAVQLTDNRRLSTVNRNRLAVSGNRSSALIDPFGGLDDLKNKVIRTVGKPLERFSEDYSRMLRAIRFAVQLNFTIDKITFFTIQKNIKNINKTVAGQRIVPAEVIAKELVKAMAADPVLTMELLDKAGAIKILMPELLKMKNCPQPQNFHSEGDVWKHTLLALNNLESKSFKKEFKNSLISDEVKWGLLFHDLGKPYTITMEDRIRFNNHDNVSAKKFGEIAERLKLSSAGLNTDTVEKIIAKHMLPTHSKMEMMKETTIEKYFFSDKFPGLDLLMLIFADISATVPPSGKPDFSSYKKMMNRINKLKGKNRNKKILPKPVVNGNDLIKTFKLKPGPKIGELLAILREAQLSGKIKNKKEGLKYIKKFL